MWMYSIQAIDYVEFLIIWTQFSIFPCMQYLLKLNLPNQIHLLLIIGSVHYVYKRKLYSWHCSYIGSKYII